MLTSNAQIQQQLLLQQQQQQQNWPQQQQQQQQGPQQHHRPSIGPPQLSLGDGIQIVVDDVDHFAKQQHVPGMVFCSSDRENFLKFEAEGREIAKFFRSIEQFIQTVKGQKVFC